MCAGNRPGRPFKLTPEAADLLVAVLRAGGDVTAAARAAGVGRRTVYDWLAPWRV